VTQTIVTGGKLKLSQEVAAAAVARAERDAIAQHGRVLTDVRMAFFDVLIAQAAMQAAKELEKIAEDGVAMAKESAEKNKTAPNDQIEAGIEVRSAQLWLRAAENRLRAERTALAAALGSPCELQERIVGPFEALPPERTWEQSLERLMCLSPELGSAAAQNDQARWALARARAERVPDVQVQGFVNWRDNGIGGNSDGFLQASLPLTVWNANRGNIASAEADVAATARGVEVQRLQLQQRLADAFERYKDARQQAVMYRDEILPAATKALSLTDEEFGTGDVVYNDVLTSQRTYANARKNYLDALQAFWKAEFEIEGLLLMDSLKQ
jgi:cobalt-zinc-cadmium efflux system outer membrane protein